MTSFLAAGSDCGKRTGISGNNKNTMIRTKKDQASFLPHFGQNLAPGRAGLPQAVHTDNRGAGVTGAAGAGALAGTPQFRQNFLPGVSGAPQFAQAG